MNKVKTLLSLVSVVLLITFSACNKEEDPIVVPTSLKIKVVDGSDNPVDSAFVKIYTNGTDWSNSKNAVYKEYTNTNGEVSFEDIEIREYYIEALKGSLNNWFGTNNTNGSITANKVNSFTIVVK